MSWLSITQSAIKIVDKWLKEKNNQKAEKKQKDQIKDHQSDLKDVIYKTDHHVPHSNMTELGKIRVFVVEKQGNLANRKLIPHDIRKDGETVYAASLAKIDACRNRLLKAA